MVFATDSTRTYRWDHQSGQVSVVAAPGMPAVNDLVFTAGGDPATAAINDYGEIAFQGAVNAQTRLKRTPKLSFMADPAVATGAAVEELLRRLPDIEITAQPDMLQSNFIHGIKRMPCRFTPVTA